MAGKITQSVSWWCYVPGLLAADEFVAAVKRAGFVAIDLVPPEHWARVRDGGLQISSAVGHASIELGLNCAEQHARIAQELGETLRWPRSGAFQIWFALAAAATVQQMQRPRISRQPASRAYQAQQRQPA